MPGSLLVPPKLSRRWTGATADGILSLSQGLRLKQNFISFGSCISDLLLNLTKAQSEYWLFGTEDHFRQAPEKTLPSWALRGVTALPPPYSVVPYGKFCARR